MANTIVNKITMNDIKNYVGSLAQTNYYQVNFSDPKKDLKEHLIKYADFADIGWISRNVGLLCADASLPTSSFATSEVKDNFMGVTQEFAHTRLYTDIDFTFYVDNDYKMLRFFEGWMDFISGTSEVSADGISIDGDRRQGNYYRRMNYPNEYKVSEMYITKFERDYGVGDTSLLEYKFINAFPKGITSMPVAYGPADLLKVSVTFNYDRYIVKKIKSTITSKDSQTTALQRGIEATNKYYTDPYQEALDITKSLDDINLGRSIRGLPPITLNQYLGNQQ
jgi:hypothetical protein